MTPKKVVENWINIFNRADAGALAALYAEDAVNHQVMNEPLHGRTAIKNMFAAEFAKFKMVCIRENIFEDGDWAILEWKDPNGLRGCGFFKVQNDKIVFQRGYWDKLTLYRLNNMTVPG